MPLKRRNFVFEVSGRKSVEWRGPSRKGEAHFFNALSLLFPKGERLFMQALQDYREHPAVKADNALVADIKGFIGQEAQHTRVHLDYNEQIQAECPITSHLNQVTAVIVGAAQKLPRAHRLAITVALEHYTAILAAQILQQKHLLEDCDPEYAALWLFHSIEECEHRSVSFDVWTKAQGQGATAYLARCLAMVLVSPIFWATVTYYYAQLSHRDCATGLWATLKGHAQVARTLLGRNGVLTAALADFADFFKPSFHPSQHDVDTAMIAAFARLSQARA